VIYRGVVFGGGYLISLPGSFPGGRLKKSHSPERASEQLQNAGHVLGWLERYFGDHCVASAIAGDGRTDS